MIQHLMRIQPNHPSPNRILHNEGNSSISTYNTTNNNISSTNDFLLGEDLLSVALLVVYPMIFFTLMLVFMRLLNALLSHPTIDKMKKDYRKRRIGDKSN